MFEIVESTLTIVYIICPQIRRDKDIRNEIKIKD